MNKVLALGYDIDRASICATDGNSTVDEPNAHDDTASTVSRVASARTRLGARTFMGGLLSHDDVGPTFFNYLPFKDVLTLRQTCKYWRDLPFNHVVLRCVSPPIATILPDIAQLKDEFRILQFFHNMYCNNQQLLNGQLAILKQDKAFTTAQNNYMQCTQAYTTLQQKPDGLSVEQEKNLITLYNGLKTPYQTPLSLKMKAVSLMQESTIDPDPLYKDIQTYINETLSNEKTALFNKLRENPRSNEAKPKHTQYIRTKITEHPLLVFAKDQDGYTPLHWGVEYEEKDMAELLLANGANVDATPTEGPNKGYSPLHLAAWKGDKVIAELLLANGANMDATHTEGPNKGYTPLHLAAQYGHTETAELLIEAGAGVDAPLTDGTYKVFTPLHWAAFKGHTAVARLLIDRGGEVNVTDENGATPLHLAAQEGGLETVKALIKAGANMDAPITGGTYNGFTPLHVAVLLGHTRIAIALLKSGANPNAKDKWYQTPLHLMAKSGNPDSVTAFLKAGATVNARDNNGFTPLHFAAIFGHTRVVTALLKAKTDMTTTTNNGYTPLQLAKNEAIRSILRNAGATP